MPATAPQDVCYFSANDLAARYGVHGIPVTFFIDARGNVATEPLFGEGSRDALQPGLDKLLG